MTIEINGELVETAEIQARTASIRRDLEAEAGRPLSVDERIAAQEEAKALLIDSVLIFQEGSRLGIVPKEADVSAMLEQLTARVDGVAGCRAGADTPEARQDLRRRMTMDRVLGAWRREVAETPEPELRAFFRRHAERFRRPERVHVSHFVHSERERVTAARARIVGGEPFHVVAAECSDCPEDGGDLGWIARGTMVPEFADAVFDQRIGEMTPVFETMFGFHIAVVRARKPAGIGSFSELRTEIAETVQLLKADAEVGRRLEALRASAQIRTIR